MGFFSWDCSCCNESIKNAYTQYDNGIVLVTENDIMIDPSYNGYGDVKGKDIYILAKYKGDSKIISKIYKDSPSNIDIERQQAISEYFNKKFPIKVLHLSCYQALTQKLDTFVLKDFYDNLKVCELAEDQGFFTDEKLNEIFKDF